MGREIRRVPANWEHPQKYFPNYILGVQEIGYIPMYDNDADTAFSEWLKEYDKWIAAGHDEAIDKYGSGEYPKNQPYISFCKWNGPPPDPERYRPKWEDGHATWYQVYETVSEGTPVTPPFETKEDLIDYLVSNGDFWDQKRRKEGRSSLPCGPWTRKQAEQFVYGMGWAPSIVVNNGAISDGIRADINRKDD